MVELDQSTRPRKNKHTQIYTHNIDKIFSFTPDFYTKLELILTANNPQRRQCYSSTTFTEIPVKKSCKRALDESCESCEHNRHNKKQKINNLIIKHANLKGLTNNIAFANKSCITSNICLFTECMCDTQIKFENSVYIPGKKLFCKCSVKYKKKGRPTGGLLFVVDSNLNAKCKFISRRTGILIVNNLAIIGTYLPSHDGRPSTEITLKNELLLIELEYKRLITNNYEVMIIGDLNIDISRNYKRAAKLKEFITELNIEIKEQCFKQDLDHSYFFSYNDKNKHNTKVDVKSTIDYTLATINNNNFKKVIRFKDKINFSDHHATIIEYELISSYDRESIFTNNKKKTNNWNDIEFTTNFKRRIQVGCSNILIKIKNNEGKIDKHYVKTHICKTNQDLQFILLESAAKARNELYLSGKSKKRKFQNKSKKWWNDELRIAFNIVIRYRNELKDNEDIIKKDELVSKLKEAKKQFRTMKRFNQKLLRDNNLRKIDDLFKANKNQFWNKLKSMSNDKQDIEAELTKIKDEYQKIFTTRNKINNKYELKMKKIFDKFVEDTYDIIHNFKVDVSLISNYINDLPNGKATGISGISNEMLKNANCTELSEVITHIFGTIINFGVLPMRFNLSILKPLVKDKSKSTKEASNLRPLAISDAISNMLERLLLHFIDLVYINHHKQFGFKKQSSCSHALFVLKAAICYAKAKNKRLYAVAIDASKAFDKVNRLYLWVKLIELNIHPAIIRAIIVYYENSEIMINLNNEYSEQFKSTVGVRQGGVLSPRLFAIYIHELLKTISKMCIGLRVGNIGIDVIGYADDILIVSNVLSNVQKMLNEVDSYCNDNEIKVNGDKTVLLIFNKRIYRAKKELDLDKNQNKLNLQGIELIESYDLKYLGVQMRADQSNITHIETRCDKALKAAAMIRTKGLCEKQIHSFLKGQMFKSFIMPILTYGMDLITLNKQEFNKLRITESNIIKRFINVRSSARTKPIMNALKIESLERRITKMKLSLMARLTENHYTKTIIEQIKTSEVHMDIIEETNNETSNFSNALDFANKCKIRIEILTKASEDEYKSNRLACKIRAIFNLKNRDLISGMVMSLTSTYTPTYMLK